MPYIDVIQPEEAEGKLKEIYEELAKSRGQIAAVHKIQSLNPDSVTHHMELYMGLMFGKSPLRRYQREMMAVVVSKANDCEYCQTHHVEALNHFWKDENKVTRLKDDYTQLELEDKDQALCELAWNLTITPNWDGQERHLDHMRELGFDDRAILDATLVISYFNFVNRIVLGLGVNLEETAGTGYKYD